MILIKHQQNGDCMKKIALMTATRAEYGILRPLIYKLEEDKDIELQLLVTGMHLDKKYGYTKNELIKDGIPIFKSISILENGNSEYDISLTMANAIRGFAEYFREEKPELLIVLGDRTEILGICAAAMNARVPIAHLHGGEITEGAVDDSVRHAVTKMSYLHFPANEIYRKRIIQMGEAPERVFNVGALGVENILNVPLLSKQEMCNEIGIPYEMNYVVVTFHPVTLEDGDLEKQVNELLQTMKRKCQYFYLITKANADVGGEKVNALLQEYAKSHINVKLVASLGMVKYLSALKYCIFVLGNSSSGIIEAPIFGIPTVNIGDRQKGRLMAETVICCETNCDAICDAIEVAEQMERKPSYLYGDGNTSDKIVSIIKEFLFKDKIDLKKHFYDIQGDT